MFQSPAMARALASSVFDECITPLGSPVVPDPYYGGPAGFEHVLDLVEAACDGLVTHLQMRLAHLDRSQGD